MKKGMIIKSTKYASVGDWVILSQNIYEYKGFIAEIINSDTIKFFCLGFYGPQGKYKTENKTYTLHLSSHSYILYEDADYMTIDDLEDKRHLIDLTLDTGDDIWFRELVN